MRLKAKAAGHCWQGASETDRFARWAKSPAGCRCGNLELGEGMKSPSPHLKESGLRENEKKKRVERMRRRRRRREDRENEKKKKREVRKMGKA